MGKVKKSTPQQKNKNFRVFCWGRAQDSTENQEISIILLGRDQVMGKVKKANPQQKNKNFRVFC